MRYTSKRNKKRDWLKRYGHSFKAKRALIVAQSAVVQAQAIAQARVAIAGAGLNVGVVVAQVVVDAYVAANKLAGAMPKRVSSRSESFLATSDAFAGRPQGATLLKQSINQGVSNG